MPSLPFAHELYPSLAPRLCRCRARCRRFCRLLLSQIRMPVLESSGMLCIETLLKAASRQRLTEVFGSKIRKFFADSELFLSLCSRPRDRWGYFVLAWLGSDKAEKVRCSHVADSVASDEKVWKKLIALIGRFEFVSAYRATLRGLRQSGSESVAAYEARTTDLCSHAYAKFLTEAHLSLAVNHLIAALADSPLREYLQRERAQRTLEWLETLRIAQSREASRLSKISRPLPPLPALHTTRAVSLRLLRVTNRTLWTRVLVTKIISRHSAWVTHDLNNFQIWILVNSFRCRRYETNRVRVTALHFTIPPPPPVLEPNWRYGRLATVAVELLELETSLELYNLFKCGKFGHISSTCTAEEKSPRRCYTCGGI